MWRKPRTRFGLRSNKVGRGETQHPRNLPMLGLQPNLPAALQQVRHGAIRSVGRAFMPDIFQICRCLVFVGHECPTYSTPFLGGNGVFILLKPMLSDGLNVVSGCEGNCYPLM